MDEWEAWKYLVFIMAFDSDQQDTLIIKQEKYLLDEIAVEKVE